MVAETLAAVEVALLFEQAPVIAAPVEAHELHLRHVVECVDEIDARHKQVQNGYVLHTRVHHREAPADRAELLPVGVDALRSHEHVGDRAVRLDDRARLSVGRISFKKGR